MKPARTSVIFSTAVTLLLLASGLGALTGLSEGASHPAPPASHAFDAARGVVAENGALTATLTVNPNQVQEGNSINVQTTVSGGDPPYHYSYSGLPSGCPQQNGPSFSCNPSSTGSSTVQASVADSGTNQTESNTVSVDVTSSSNGNGNGNGNGNSGGNNSSSGLSSLFSGFSGLLSLVLVFGIVGFVTWVLLVVAVWIIAITLLRRLPKRGASAAETAGVRCVACSAMNPVGSRFCSSCGTSTAPKTA
jgi:hypothetical protein